jgi:hypothetical protein
VEVLSTVVGPGRMEPGPALRLEQRYRGSMKGTCKYGNVASIACDKRTWATYWEAWRVVVSVERRVRSRDSRTQFRPENWAEATVSDRAAVDERRARCWE